MRTYSAPGLIQIGSLSAELYPTYCCLTCLRRYSPTKLCDGAQMAIFGDFFASCISRQPRAARFRPASEIRTKATPCVEVWQTSKLRWLRLGEEKKKKEEETTGQKYNGLPYAIGRP